MFIFYALLPISSLDKDFAFTILDRYFSFGGQKKWLLVALDRWSSYTVMIVWDWLGQTQHWSS